jgi:hypothetical protein
MHMMLYILCNVWRPHRKHLTTHIALPDVNELTLVPRSHRAGLISLHCLNRAALLQEALTKIPVRLVVCLLVLKVGTLLFASIVSTIGLLSIEPSIA